MQYLYEDLHPAKSPGKGDIFIVNMNIYDLSSGGPPYNICRSSDVC